MQKPARYTGGEYGQIAKGGAADYRVALCFPDTYEIGMSNLGMKILYGVINGIDGVSCERVFAPWVDMEQQLRQNGVALYGLESGGAISGFDIVAFSLAYELSYTNVLNMLDLAGIPLLREDRQEDSPIVIAGGACCFNPEPMADFIDLFVIGEGEEAAVELVRALRTARDSGETRRGAIRAAAALEGVYAPSLYRVGYNDDGTLSEIVAEPGAALPVLKRVVPDLDGAYFPVETLIPSTGIVHDRAVIELFRGCVHGCRFCQAGHTGRPMREKSKETLAEQGIGALRASGYDELALLSLSSSDYSKLPALCDELLAWCLPRKANLSLPSLRANSYDVSLMERIQRTRKSGLTFAPEAGSQRLRDVINKNVTEEELLDSCRTAFESGRSSVKLYFMLGLPTETDEDAAAIAALSREVYRTWREHTPGRNRGVKITVSTSYFIPKPHTPFQWEPQASMEVYRKRTELLRSELKTKAITYNWHEPEQGFVEAVLSRGDRRVGKAILEACRLGAKFDSWSEFFTLGTWLKAFDNCNIDPAFYTARERGRDEILPWSVVSTGVDEGYFWDGRIAAREGKATPGCREACSGCGASRFAAEGAVCRTIANAGRRRD